MWRERNISPKSGLVDADLLQTVNRSAVVAARTTRFWSATVPGADYCNPLLADNLHMPFREVLAHAPAGCRLCMR